MYADDLFSYAFVVELRKVINLCRSFGYNYKLYVNKIKLCAVFVLNAYVMNACAIYILYYTRYLQIFINVSAHLKCRLTKHKKFSIFLASQ
jgi:hypothetical protein